HPSPLPRMPLVCRPQTPATRSMVELLVSSGRPWGARVTFPPFRSMPSVFIKTYGCQMNERDSEAVAAQLVAKGYTLAASEQRADVVLLNTCSVRDLAEQKALNKMSVLVGETRKQRPDVLLGFM